MDMRFRGADYGTLFSTAAALIAPSHSALTARPLYDDVPALRLRPAPKRHVDGLISRLFAWHERARQRWLLSGLDDHMLRDIGLSRADVEGEVSKHFWQP